jgi:hypothetical protein
MDPELFEFFAQQERLADSIFIDQRQIIDLDASRKANMESLARLRRHKLPNEHPKHWMKIGTLFVKVDDPTLEASLTSSFGTLFHVHFFFSSDFTINYRRCPAIKGN